MSVSQPSRRNGRNGAKSVRFFLSPELWPFTLATGLLLAVTALEGLALVAGASMFHWADAAGAHPGDAAEPDGPVSAALGWMHIGKVPVLAILVIFLTAFAVTGFVAQLAIKGATGAFTSPLLGSLIAAIAGVLAVRMLGGVLGRLIPKDESSAVADATLVGRVGIIVIGVARAGRPAQARINDEHGTTHYIMVEPEAPGETLQSGSSVLLVRHLKGRHFQAIHNPKPGLL
jgi:hypothetical protein